MARVGLAMCIATAIIATMWVESSAQSCTPAIVSLTPCFTFLAGNSSAPSDLCCSQLAAIAGSEAMTCLCNVLSFGISSILGIPITQSQAATLPGNCKVTIPSLSTCTAVSQTPAATSPSATTTTKNTTSPQESPAPTSLEVPPEPTEDPTSTALTPPVSTIPKGSGKATPATLASSALLTRKLNHPSLLFFVLFAAYATGFEAYELKP